MKVTLPEKVTGARDALFVLEVEFPVATEERVVEVETTGAIEPLDLSGSSRGGTYRVPVGLERLHVPLRVTEDAVGEASLTVSCAQGPEAGQTVERTLVLEEATARAAGSGKRWLGVAAAVVLVAGGAWLVSQLFGKGGVPDLRGLTHEEAEARLAEENLRPEIRYEPAETAEDEGVVMRTIPGAGEAVPDDGAIEVVLGRPSGTLVGIPAVVGDTAEAAEAALRALGYSVQQTMEDVDEPSQYGRVLSQSPEAGTPLPARSEVEIFVGRAPDRFEVPPVVGLAAGPAREALETLGLVVVVEDEDVADAGQAGTVVRANPGPGEPAAPGDVITLHVGRAGGVTPPPVEPPDVPMPDVPMPDVPMPDVPMPDVPMPDVPEPVPAPDVPTPDVPTPDVPTPAVVQPLVPDADGLLLIPDMTGWSRSEAEEALRAVGLVPVVTLVPAERAQDTGNVTRHRPGAGEKRGSATMIFLYVGEGTPVAPPDAPLPDVPTPDVPMPDVPEPTVPTPDVPEPAVPPMPPDVPEPMPGEPGPRPDVPEPLPDEPFPDVPAPLPDVPEPAAPTPVPPPVQPGQPRPVPDVVGEKRVKAEGLIRAAGLQYHIVLKVTDYPPDGTVLGQDPAPGETLPPGGEVVIEVAKAPAGARIPVPQVTGLERAVAERMLREAGFLVNVSYGGGAADEQGLITDQAPQAESLAPRRSWVEIVVVSGTGARRTARGGPPSLGPPGPRAGPGPGNSAGLSDAPAVGPGAVNVPPPTPRGPTPLPPVQLPPRGSPKTASVPSSVGRNARDAIAAVLQAGLIPIVEVDRSSPQAAGTVVKESPQGGQGALPGDLVRLTVAVGAGGGPYVDLPTTIGAEVRRARQMFAGGGTAVNVVELSVPGHPYAGTGRVAAQYPVSRMPSSLAAPVTLWIILP
jgi:beta-lactam-binding protein with PASTA domain